MTLILAVLVGALMGVVVVLFRAIADLADRLNDTERALVELMIWAIAEMQGDLYE